MLILGQHQTFQQNQIPCIGLDFCAVGLVLRLPDLPEIRPSAEVNPLARIRSRHGVMNVTTEGNAAVVGGAFLPAVEVGEGRVEPGVARSHMGGEEAGEHKKEDTTKAAIR